MENLKGRRDHLRDLGIDRRIMLKCVLNISDIRGKLDSCGSE
jgi:hypothetical protein